MAWSAARKFRAKCVAVESSTVQRSHSNVVSARALVAQEELRGERYRGKLLAVKPADWTVNSRPVDQRQNLLLVFASSGIARSRKPLACLLGIVSLLRSGYLKISSSTSKDGFLGHITQCRQWEQKQEGAQESARPARPAARYRKTAMQLARARASPPKFILALTKKIRGKTIGESLEPQIWVVEIISAGYRRRESESRIQNYLRVLRECQGWIGRGVSPAGRSGMNIPVSFVYGRSVAQDSRDARRMHDGARVTHRIGRERLILRNSKSWIERRCGPSDPVHRAQALRVHTMGMQRRESS
ncbi:hypothetical protein FB451DRAFT_1198114 [Mycena latifolia]|nr:hypothetical protein FB451DRAFT_1198114 [Mycena latifolia]